MAVFNTRTWTMEETADGPRVVIPAPFIWPLSIFLGFWLCGWTAGEVSAARQLLEMANTAGGWQDLLPGGFLLFWLAAWTAVGIFTWGAFLFSIQGREVVSLNGHRLRIRLETLLGLGWSWNFPLAEMAPPRLMVPPAPDAGYAPAAGPRPRYSGITISCGGRKWRLGLGLDESAARDLLYTLSSRFGLPRAGEPEQQRDQD